MGGFEPGFSSIGSNHSATTTTTRLTVLRSSYIFCLILGSFVAKILTLKGLGLNPVIGIVY